MKVVPNKKYFTYILLCSDDSFYVGITTDIHRRVEEHNGLKKGGARYTKGRRPVALVYSEEYISRSEAQKREAHLKSLSRKEKELLVISLTTIER